MNYHNPKNLTEWGQADGWRLTLGGEPLPEDAEFLGGEGYWFRTGRKGSIPGDATYRTKKPLPVSPLISQLDAEIKAKQELREIALVVEAGAEWEYFLEFWCKPLVPFEEAVRRGWQVRLKPKPVTRPWSFDTRPRGVVWVFKKGFITDRMITAWRDDGAEIGEYDKPSYQELFDNWLQRDGSICGETTEEAK